MRPFTNLFLWICFLCQAEALSLSCTPSKKASVDASPTGIEYITKMDIANQSGEIMTLNDTLQVYYYKNLVLYRIPYTFFFSEVNINPNTGVQKDGPQMMEIRRDDFLVRQGDSVGIFYPHESKLLPAQKQHSDTTIGLRLPPPALLQIIYSENDTVLKSEKIADTLIEVSRPKIKVDDTYQDSTYLYFSKELRHLRFVLSPQVDSIKNSRLFKIRIVYNKFSDSRYPNPIPRRELSFELKQKTINDRKQILDLFARYDQDKERLLK